jgi:hypothetical protein
MVVVSFLFVSGKWTPPCDRTSQPIKSQDDGQRSLVALSGSTGVVIVEMAGQ